MNRFWVFWGAQVGKSLLLCSPIVEKRALMLIALGPAQSLPGCPLPHVCLWLPIPPRPFATSMYLFISILLTYCIGRCMKTELWFYSIAQYIQNPTTFILSWPNKVLCSARPIILIIHSICSTHLQSLVTHSIIGHKFFIIPNPPPPHPSMPTKEIASARQNLPSKHDLSKTLLILL